MKKIILTMLLLSNYCYAETFRYDKPTICNDTISVLEMLREYDEKVVFSGNPEGMNEQGSQIVLTENTVTGTWTVLQLNERYACVIAVGKNEKS